LKRVAITGMGCVTPLGNSADLFQQNLFAGRDGFRPIPDIAAGDLRFSQTAQVLDFDATALLTPEQAQLSERSSRFALAAARQAIQQSGVLAQADRSNVAVVLGCSTGGRSAEEPETAKLYLQKSRVHPLTVPRAMASAGTSLVCIEHGITGPAYTVSTACASATHAIGQAFHMVRSGMVTAAITGGHEAPLTYGFLKAWDSLRVVSSTRCRPFAQDRDGMTLGEGAAILALEDMEVAERRGAEIFAEIVGFGMSCDAGHMTQPKAEGPGAAIASALRDCGALRKPVEYINAHGTGTLANDAAEAAAIRAVFGADAQSIAVSSTKSMHGHAMGASGAIEALATVMALQHGILPITAGVECVDSTLGIDVIVTASRRKRASMALSNSFAFGGLNAVIAFVPYGGA
jgi:nodulation protein E